MSAGRRMASRSSKRRSAPILFYLPGNGKELGRGFDRITRYNPAPASRFQMFRTGQLYHLFVDCEYIDTFTSPEISDTYQSQARTAHVRAAVARGRA